MPAGPPLRRQGSTSARSAEKVGPVNLEVSVQYRRELVLGDEVEVETRFEYPSPRIVRVVQTVIRGADRAVAAELVSTTGLLDLSARRLVVDAGRVWRRLVADPAAIDLPAEN